MADGLVVTDAVPCGSLGTARIVDARTLEVEVQSSRQFGIEGSLETWVCGRIEGHKTPVEVRVVNEHGNMQFLRPVYRLQGCEWRHVARFGPRTVRTDDVFAFEVPHAAGAPVDFATWWPYTEGDHAALLEHLEAASAATIEEVGRTEHDRTLHAVTIADGSPTTTLAITAGFHGGEPSSLWAADALLRFAASAAGEPLRRAVRIAAVPAVNLDAIVEGLDRRSAGGINLWLDASAKTAPEVRAVDQFLHAARPAAVVDIHSWHWHGDGCYTPGWLAAGDALYREVMRLRAAIDREFPMGGQLFFTDDPDCWSTRTCVELGVPAIDAEVSLARGTDGAWKTLDRARDDGVAILRGAAAYLTAAGRA
jgi:hypothetical protein